MNRHKTILKYFIITIIFSVIISTVNPASVNAVDSDKPYNSSVQKPIKK